MDNFPIWTVKYGRIYRGSNQRVQKDDPMAHAEIDCLRNAGRIGSYKDTVLYSTLMPCYLCGGAVVQFGIKKSITMMQDFIEKNHDLWFEDIGK